MMSGFIGQFLPLSGGSLGGALSLGGNDLDYLGNIKDSAGSTRIQIINSGTNRALNLLDDAANVMMTVNENGVSVAGFLSLAANDGLGIDGVGLFFGDGSGNLEIDGTTVLIVPTVTGSSGTIAGVRVNAGLTISGSVTAKPSPISTPMPRVRASIRKLKPAIKFRRFRRRQKKPSFAVRVARTTPGPRPSIFQPNSE
jgi:hypothetical protein